MDSTKFQHMPIQMISLADEKGKETNRFPFPTSVFRYPVQGGWIVGTVIGDGGAPAFSQTFVPDPDYVWNPTLRSDEQQG